MALRSLDYVSDHAISAPEATLALMYSLPNAESGYGMGPIVLNERVDVNTVDNWSVRKNRFPDLVFSFAPMGLNYDGEGHLDLASLVSTAQQAALAEPEQMVDAKARLLKMTEEIRAKVVDDNMRNRQLAARGKVVFPVTKEDLYGNGHLDNLTRQILNAAHSLFGINTSEYEQALDDSSQKRDRQALLDSFLPHLGLKTASYGRM